MQQDDVKSEWLSFSVSPSLSFSLSFSVSFSLRLSWSVRNRRVNSHAETLVEQPTKMTRQPGRKTKCLDEAARQALHTCWLPGYLGETDGVAQPAAPRAAPSDVRAKTSLRPTSRACLRLLPWRRETSSPLSRPSGGWRGSSGGSSSSNYPWHWENSAGGRLVMDDN